MSRYETFQYSYLNRLLKHSLIENQIEKFPVQPQTMYLRRNVFLQIVFSKSITGNSSNHAIFETAVTIFKPLLAFFEHCATLFRCSLGCPTLPLLNLVFPQQPFLLDEYLCSSRGPSSILPQFQVQYVVQKYEIGRHATINCFSWKVF